MSQQLHLIAPSSDLEVDTKDTKRFAAVSTKIGWAHFTLNHWRGCSKVSAGCRHCYAETLVNGRMGGDFSITTPTKSWRSQLSTFRRLATDPAWRAWAGLDLNAKPRVFAGSLMDPFQGLRDQRDLLFELFEAIRDTSELNFLLLTKRPQRISDLMPSRAIALPNMWLGVSVESGEDHIRDAETGLPVRERVAALLKVPAAGHFVSYEPAIGPLATHLAPFLTCKYKEYHHPRTHWGRAISWVIMGGESGKGFRPMNLDWAREMRDVCRKDRVAFFFKQRAAFRPGSGDTLDGVTIQEYPEVLT